MDFSIFFGFFIFLFFYFFGFFSFSFSFSIFWIFLFSLPSHEDTYLIGLTIHKLPKAGLILFHLGLPLTASFFLFHLGLPLIANNFHLFLGLGPICDEFRTWASNLVIFFLLIYFIRVFESLCIFCVSCRFVFVY